MRSAPAWRHACAIARGARQSWRRRSRNHFLATLKKELWTEGDESSLWRHQASWVVRHPWHSRASRAWKALFRSCVGTRPLPRGVKNLVNNAPAGLSAALDNIPLVGEITQAQYDAFVVEFRTAFQGKAHQGGCAVASRLLAVKRPDVFVAVNSQNRRGLCEALVVAHSTLDLDNFWERIVEPVRMSPWWLASRPKGGVEARLWDCRAAMLDSLYYEGNAG